MGTTWFTSDWHLGHRNINALCNRGFVDTDEMDSEILSNMRSAVSTGDRLFILGDISFHKTNKTIDMLSSIKCDKYLLIGNHDKNHIHKSKFKEEFIWTNYLDEVKVDGVSVVLCHYPILSWNKKDHGSIHLHGHTHGSLDDDLSTHHSMIDVGVDSWEMHPVDMDMVHGERDYRAKERTDKEGGGLIQ